MTREVCQSRDTPHSGTFHMNILRENMIHGAVLRRSAERTEQEGYALHPNSHCCLSLKGGDLRIQPKLQKTLRQGKLILSSTA